MIGIVDYGLGNVNSFLNIYNKLNIPVQLASTKEALQASDKIILPGVGSFDYAMNALDHSGLRDSLNDLVLINKVPVLGVCVGMQMMGDTSEEGGAKGLGWISGAVKKMSFVEHESLPLPHMGWNALNKVTESPLFGNIPNCSEFYFLHSYYFDAKNKEDVLATADYLQTFPVIVNQENIFGIQCHPEKSHQQGSMLLKNFAEL
jgi:imidazole glycerol-phosphate synthase subunit HisH